MDTPWCRRDGDDLVLHIHVQPKSSRDCIDGLYGNRLKIRITAPPTDGKANAHLQRYLASLFDVSRSQIHLESGRQGRTKLVRVLQAGEIPAELTAIKG